MDFRGTTFLIINCCPPVLGHHTLPFKTFLFLLSSIFRSLVAEVVDQTELGAVYGLLAIMDAILPYICETTQPFKFKLFKTLHFSLSFVNKIVPSLSERTTISILFPQCRYPSPGLYNVPYNPLYQC